MMHNKLSRSEAVQKVIDRCAAVIYDRERIGSFADVVLMREYLHRHEEWYCRRFAGKDFSLWGDVAALIDPTIRATADELTQLHQAIIGKTSLEVCGEQVEYYLHWCVLKSESVHDVMGGLRDPWEPLIRLMERSCLFRVENSSVRVGGYPIRFQTFGEHRKTFRHIDDLSDIALQRIDEDFAAGKFSSWIKV